MRLVTGCVIVGATSVGGLTVGGLLGLGVGMIAPWYYSPLMGMQYGAVQGIAVGFIIGMAAVVFALAQENRDLRSQLHRCQHCGHDPAGGADAGTSGVNPKTPPTSAQRHMDE